MRLSKEKRDKIAEQVLSFLYHNNPKLFFTSEISRECARDEEFIKDLLFELKSKGLLVTVKKNPKGVFYSRRIRWQLSQKAYQAYSQHV